MKNIHILPTDKPSRLKQNNITKKISLVNKGIDLTAYTPINIYITSPNEDINENDFIITKDGRLVQVSYLLSKDIYSASKVTLATDVDLIKDGVQAIDDNFLEWFVKNPKSENVYVYKEYKQVNQNNPVTRGSTALAFSHYEVQSLDLSSPIVTNEKEIMANLPNGDDFFKQETLEEAARNYKYLKLPDDLYDGFIAGAKWQQERMYSEEEVIKILLARNADLGIIGKTSAVVEFIKQFKKK